MRDIKKVIFASILFLLFICSSSFTVFADGSTQRIYDYANLLSDEEVEALEQLADEHSEKRKTDFIIVITEDTDGKTVEQYMADFYDEMAFGYDKPHGSTVILAIDIDNRDFYIASFEGAQKHLDSQRVDLLFNELVPPLSADKYFDAFKTFVETGSRYMRYMPGVNPESIIFDTWFHVIIALLIGGIIVGTMAYNSGGKVTVNERTYTGDFKVLKRKDIFLTKNVTKRKKPSNNNRGGSGGGGGVTRGGSSYTGKGGSF
ncbi:TPM domain-containing protein [Ornithinibacillus sp. JPR2-1]|uniref:TPM domain-containing protein n=1 Tax=Ornithinibacillus sp. JPR2-1 TaxID=2094019 RepID=UPI0031DB0A50